MGISAFAGPEAESLDVVDGVDGKEETIMPTIRKNFPESWIFDTFDE